MDGLFDTHAHLCDSMYTEQDRLACWDALEDGRLAGIMDVGYDLATSRLAAAHAAAHPHCFAAVGIHPLFAEGAGASAAMGADALTLGEMLDELAWLCLSEGVRAIGEAGLDYHRRRGAPSDACGAAQGTAPGTSPRACSAPERIRRQDELFRAQIGLAKQLGLPLIVHDREAHGDVLRILKEEAAFAGAGVLLHSYSGSAELAREYAALGAMLSFSGVVTWAGNRKTALACAAVPDAQLLIETDAPWLAPEPRRGGQNSPLLLGHTAKRVAEIRGVTPAALAELTRENALRFFGLDA
ncbi:MAG: TatD family hydrolase [Clostridiales Family XIII bacterium]|jgi:TatD DNase family protein|nr:TatD family hydrolase [Clostridiales Family XIII bacterium]